MNSHPNEKIESNRLILRKVEEEDWQVLYTTITNSTFPDNLSLKGFIQTENDAQQWVKDAIQKWKESTRYTWTACLKENPKVAIGQVAITKRSESDKWGLAFWIAHEYHNVGYAKESVIILTETLKIGSKTLQFFAGAATWNNASNKVLIDSGFKKISMQEKGDGCHGKTISDSTNEYEKV